MNETIFSSEIEFAVVLFVIMLAGGAFGGWASYFLNDSESKSKTKSIILGISASMIVPVFLSMISSNLLVVAQKEIDKLFILSGFFVLAGVFSRNFLENIYSKVLQQVGDIGKKVKTIEESSEEIDIPSEILPEGFLEKNNINEEEYKLMNTLLTGTYTYRSTSGLIQDSQLERKHIEKALNTLLAKKLIGSRVNKKDKIRYYLSSEGRQLLGKLSIENE